ncbi:von Hippel-Lindau disease tumor suppressor [Amyelois transitella]|uniref:von Hippel-Lindau disease tumor suppressor n=1 Tax=Amyelois transitella TaxID=680683 RepID=UPI00298F9D6A|nr:von Hippel-Lindau disease tumor suppressor [Amyelois transitella]XP_060807299.1 von Hippel-Lindau disease tumor suppressor [Amyelois transitella]
MPGSDEYYLYETNEKGEQVLVKSLRSEKKAYIRFVNRTSRPVSVWWRDYNGHRQHYVIMPPNSYYNTDTYISHPWEFTDACTQERYVINNKQIFRAPECIANVQTRTTWYITIGVRSLLSTVMLSVASRLNNVEHVDALGLPKMLANELKSLVDKLRTQVVINHARR